MFAKGESDFTAEREGEKKRRLHRPAFLSDFAVCRGKGSETKNPPASRRV
jgi:hypothetical protein